ncbi:MAG: hypothetical protein J0L84_14815, partial [Verrucomicrobia bacterium]|nr:hypothetical protein [Verrucomicrobiota bacterium]
MNPARTIIGASLAAIGVLTFLLLWRPESAAPGGEAAGPRRPLLVYCAAGLKAPIEAVARDYERRTGV